MKLSFTALCVSAIAGYAAAQDIPATAVANGFFTTLVAALGAADLVDTLSSPNGPYTVFAPTDAAFAGLPAGLVDCLLLEKNVGLLSDILTYHVVDGAVSSTALVEGPITSSPTLTAGAELMFDTSSGVVVSGATSATVTTADVAADNGIIHVIDTVLVPPGTDVPAFLATCMQEAALVSIPATAVAAGVFDTLVAALTAAELVGALEADGPFTVFAPTDDAFDMLPAELVPCLLKEENVVVLSDILKYHVIAGAAVMSGDLTDGQTAATLQGEDITVDLMDGVKINESTVTTADVAAANGVIHIIDAVLVPPSVDVTGFLEGCAAADIPNVENDGEGGDDDDSASSTVSLVASAALVAMAVMAF